MTLDPWAYLSDVLAAVAVVVSLIYLGRQVHQSNMLSRAQTSQNMIQLARHEIEKLEDPELWFAWTKENISVEAKFKIKMNVAHVDRLLQDIEPTGYWDSLSKW